MAALNHGGRSCCSLVLRPASLPHCCSHASYHQPFPNLANGCTLPTATLRSCWNALAFLMLPPSALAKVLGAQRSARDSSASVKAFPGAVLLGLSPSYRREDGPLNSPCRHFAVGGRGKGECFRCKTRLSTCGAFAGHLHFPGLLRKTR